MLCGLFGALPENAYSEMCTGTQAHEIYLSVSRITVLFYGLELESLNYSKLYYH